MTELTVGNAKHITGHILEVTFNDGNRQEVDFAPFIFSNGHPDYDQYKVIENFLNYKITDGNLNWDNYTMIFPVEDLYKNNINKKPPV